MSIAVVLLLVLLRGWGAGAVRRVTLELPFPGCYYCTASSV